MKKNKIILISLLIVILLVAIFLIKRRAMAPTTTPDQIWVATQVAKKETLPLETQAIGTLVARSVEITPEVSGHVNKILFKDGTWVTAGTPLVQLDAAVSQAQLQSAKAQLAYSENDYNRKKLLGKRGVVAKQAIEQALADFKEKKAKVAEMAVAVAKMTLTAPFDGMVGRSQVNPGDYVTIGKSLVTITDTRHLRVDYNVPEQYLPLLKLGQQVTLKAPAYADMVFSGKITFISPTINTDNRSISLYAEIDNANHQLAPGMFVHLVHSFGDSKPEVILPARSVVLGAKGPQVFKVENGKAKAFSVTIGKRNQDRIQILTGVAANDLIIVDGYHKVSDGVPVNIKT